MLLRATRTLVVVLLGVLCFGALGTSGAAAAKMKLRHHHGGMEEELGEEGELILASTNFAFTTSAGTLECAGADVYSRLAGDEGTTSIALEAFDAIAFGEQGLGSACRSSLTDGPAVFSASGLPWKGELTARGAFELKGDIGFELSFPEHAGVHCLYTTKKLKSAYTAGTLGEPAPLEVATTAQKLTRSKGASSTTCPKKGTLSALWATNLEGEIER
jgi:hypothetical protein